MTNREDTEFPIYVFGDNSHNLNKFLVLPVKEWFRDMINDFPIHIWNHAIKSAEELNEEFNGEISPYLKTMLWYDKWLTQFDDLREKPRFDIEYTCPKCGTWDIEWYDLDAKCPSCEIEFTIKEKEDDRA